MRLINLITSAALALVATTGSAFANNPINVPEPASFVSLGFGVGFALLARRRIRQNQSR